MPTLHRHKQCDFKSSECCAMQPVQRLALYSALIIPAPDFSYVKKMAVSVKCITAWLSAEHPRCWGIFCVHCSLGHGNIGVTFHHVGSHPSSSSWEQAWILNKALYCDIHMLMFTLNCVTFNTRQPQTNLCSMVVQSNGR